MAGAGPTWLSLRTKWPGPKFQHKFLKTIPNCCLATPQPIPDRTRRGSLWAPLKEFKCVITPQATKLTVIRLHGARAGAYAKKPRGR